MSGPPTLLPIVEGQSEEQGVPVLLRRLLVEIGAPDVQIARPFRIKRTRVLAGGEVDDQPAFAELFDLDAARARCPSFQFLCDELRRLLAEIAVAP